jgi:hypothetical protein
LPEDCWQAGKAESTEHQGFGAQDEQHPQINFLLGTISLSLSIRLWRFSVSDSLQTPARLVKYSRKL